MAMSQQGTTTLTAASVALGPDRGFAPFVGPGDQVLMTRFGPIHVDEQRLVWFPAGIPGFPGRHRFQLERIGGAGLLLLQSADDAALGFFVMPIVEQGWSITAADRAAACRLLLLDPFCTDFLAIVTASRGPAGFSFFANLRAPLAIEAKRRLGAQIVLADPAHPLRHPIVVPR